MAAKLGIVGLSRGIAIDMQRFKVRSNCIAPFAWSRMTSSVPANTEAEKQRLRHRSALLDPRTREPVHVLFAYRGRRLGEDFLNTTLIPALCRKAGVPAGWLR